MTVEEASVKGAVLNGYFKFIRRKWGKHGLEQCIRETGLDDFDIKEGNWYPHVLSTRVLTWIAETRGPEHLEECGSHTVKDLGIFSYMVRFLDVEKIVRRARKSYSEAFNFGDFRIVIGENRATISITGNADEKGYACRTWTGVFRGIIEMTKSRGSVEKEECQAEGAECCVWKMEWE